jgi:protein-S-isoprenylcysteine O-methyltransferase Ste14
MSLNHHLHHYYMRFIKFLFGVILFAVLPLLGWGINDLPGFFNEPARITYIAAAVLLQGFIVMKWPDGGRQGGSGNHLVSRQRVAIILLQIFSLSLMFTAPCSDRWSLVVLGDAALVRWTGVVLYAVGFMLMNWSEAALGSQFSIQVTLQEGHRLVTDGPYRFVRHPRYAGTVLYAAGFSLVFQSGAGLLLSALTACVLLWRIHDEEVLLSGAFGKEWEDYVRRSKKLLPFVY